MTEYREKNHERLCADQKRWRDRNSSSEKYKLLRQEYQKRHRDKLRTGDGDIKQYLRMLLASIKKQGTRKRIVPVIDINIEFLLILWQQQSGLCAISGLPMVIKRGELKSVSIDRCDSNKMYTRDNIQLVCKWANLGKHHHSNIEIQKIIEELKCQK